MCPNCYAGGWRCNLKAVSPALPKKKTTETLRSVRPLLKELVRPRRGKLALGFALMLINIVAAWCCPASTKFLIDNVIGKHQVLHC